MKRAFRPVSGSQWGFETRRRARSCSRRWFEGVKRLFFRFWAKNIHFQTSKKHRSWEGIGKSSQNGLRWALSICFYYELSHVARSEKNHGFGSGQSWTTKCAQKSPKPLRILLKNHVFPLEPHHFPLVMHHFTLIFPLGCTILHPATLQISHFPPEMHHFPFGTHPAYLANPQFPPGDAILFSRLSDSPVHVSALLPLRLRVSLRSLSPSRPLDAFSHMLTPTRLLRWTPSGHSPASAGRGSQRSISLVLQPTFIEFCNTSVRAPVQT